jgi:hypothetical protein
LSRRGCRLSRKSSTAHRRLGSCQPLRRRVL